MAPPRFVARPDKIQGLLRDPRVKDMHLLAHELPLFGRVVSWFMWSWPLKFLFRRRYRNPWAHVVVTMKDEQPPSAPREKPELDAPDSPAS